MDRQRLHSRLFAVPVRNSGDISSDKQCVCQGCCYRRSKPGRGGRGGGAGDTTRPSRAAWQHNSPPPPQYPVPRCEIVRNAELVHNLKASEITDAIARASAGVLSLVIDPGVAAFRALIADGLKRGAVVDPAPGSTRDGALAPARTLWYGANGDVAGVEPNLLPAYSSPSQAALADELERVLLEARLVEGAVCRAQPVCGTSIDSAGRLTQQRARA